ncbi:restriction endonuclease subunit S [Nocardia sp. NPDC047038]|uniref:restriction endonuclease subunit S n=1 Tax=Nocardia sp. NPDC047038 TaxID=3154338 RepID=UPI0033C0D0FF
MTEVTIAPWLASSRWPTAPIRLVASLGTGHTPSRKVPEYWDNCTIPWVTLADVWQLRSGGVDVISETKEKISELGMENSSAALHPPGTVILSRTASVGFSAMLGTAMATSQDFATWTCGQRLDPRFLLHVLRGMAPDLKRVSMGSTHKTIYMPDIEQLRTPLPPLEEQRRIADFLDAETARIEKLRCFRERQQACLLERQDSYIASQIDRLFCDHGRLALRRVTTSIEQGWSPQCDEVGADPAEWAVLKTSAVSSGEFRPLEHKRLPFDVEPDLRYQIRDGDILMTRGSGSAAHVGVAALVRTDGRQLLLSDLLYRIRLESAWFPEFVQIALRSKPVRGLVHLLLRGQSGQTIKLRVEDVGAIEIPFVPPADQPDIAYHLRKIVSDTSDSIKAIERSNSLLIERRQALITAAVTGQFDVTTASGRNITQGV